MNNEAPKNQGPAPEPRESDIALPPLDHIADPNELHAPAPGEGWQAGMQESAPPQAPQSAAETAELKQKLGQALQAIGELKQENTERAMDADVERALATAQPQAPQMDLSKFPKEKLNEPLTVQDFMVAMQEVYPRLVAEAQASVARANWNVTPQEQAAALQRYPQLSQIQEGSPEQLAALQRVVDVMRSRSAQPAQVAPSAQAATAQPTRTPQRVAPMVEQSSPSEMPDGGGQSELALARVAYEKAKLIPNQTDKVNAMRTAWQRITTLSGVSQEDIHSTNWRNKS